MNPKIELMLRYLDETIDQAEAEELSELIRTDPSFRREASLLLLQDVHLCQLADQARASGQVWLAEPSAQPGLVQSLAGRFREPKVLWALAAMLVAGVVWFLGMPRLFHGTSEPKLAALEGGGRVLRQGESRPAELPMRFQPKDQLMLEPGGSALVRYDREATWFQIADGARIRFEEAGQGKSILIESGALNATIAPQPAGAPFQFTTPTARATVLGTDLTLVAAPDRTRLEVWKGTVRLTRLADGTSADVHAGEFAVAQAEGALTTVAFSRGVLRESWNGVAPVPLPDLSQAVAALREPQAREIVPDFSTLNSRGDRFFARFRALVRPPVTGAYQFWVAGDDRAELWLSRSELAEGREKICATKEWTGRLDWDRTPEQSSKPIQLEAGRAYYLEALHFEGGGADHLAVAWRVPGGEREVVAGIYLTPPRQTDGLLVPADSPDYRRLPPSLIP